MTKTVSAVILAAGSSRRMGDENKLTKVLNGKPLVRHVVDAVIASDVNDFVVVTGFQEGNVLAALPDVLNIHNPDFEAGMGTSVSCGVALLVEASDPDGIVILLGDMPLVEARHINALIDTFSGKDVDIICASNEGKIGNPVLFGRSYFSQLRELEGDRGARRIIEQSNRVKTVEIGRAGAMDFDTPTAFDAYSETATTAPKTS